MSKKNGKPDIPFYERKESYTKAGRIGIIGCLFLLASTFFYWKNLLFRISERKYSGISFISMVRKGFQIGISLKTLILPALLFLFYAVVVFLAIAAYKDNISKQPFFIKRKKRIRLAALALTLILVILMVISPIFRESSQQLKSTHQSWRAFIDSSINSYMPGVGEMYSYYLIGPGFIMYIVGVILYLISLSYNFVLETLNE